MPCRLGCDPRRTCPHRQSGECSGYNPDREERAGIVAHHRGLAYPPLSPGEAMELAKQQEAARAPGSCG